jgi:hypothetical protein
MATRFLVTRGHLRAWMKQSIAGLERRDLRTPGSSLKRRETRSIETRFFSPRRTHCSRRTNHRPALSPHGLTFPGFPWHATSEGARPNPSISTVEPMARARILRQGAISGRNLALLEIDEIDIPSRAPHLACRGAAWY